MNYIHAMRTARGTKDVQRAEEQLYCHAQTQYFWRAWGGINYLPTVQAITLKIFQFLK